MNKKVHTSFRIDEELWSNFQATAKENGYSATGALRVLITSFVNKNK
ncbi:MAG: hypothetical protein G8D88_13925 [gamma proteobacterium symbiont of Ctena orbiculata]